MHTTIVEFQTGRRAEALHTGYLWMHFISALAADLDACVEASCSTASAGQLAMALHVLRFDVCVWGVQRGLCTNGILSVCCFMS